MKASDGKYYQEVAVEPLAYKGGETLTPNGKSTACTIPSGANMVAIAANGGDVYYAINPGAGAASAASPGFVKDGQHWIVGPLSNLTALKVYTAAGAAKAHIEYYAG